MFVVVCVGVVWCCVCVGFVVIVVCCIALACLVCLVLSRRVLSCFEWWWFVVVFCCVIVFVLNCCVWLLSSFSVLCVVCVCVCSLINAYVCRVLNRSSSVPVCAPRDPTSVAGGPL